MAPSGVNDIIRAVMGAIKRFWRRLNMVVTSGGAANVQTLTYGVAGAAYYTGEIFTFLAGFANTASATLNVDGLGAKTIKTIAGDALAGGEIQTAPTMVAYDGTDMRLLSLYYKRATYTPALTLGGGSVTYTTQYGDYTRIGNLVRFTAKIVVNTPTTPSGTLHISLPFAVKNVTHADVPLTCQTVGTTAGTYGSIARAVINTSTAKLMNLTGNPSAEGDIASTLAAGCTIYVAGSYETNS
jgi:hypothetical protein